MQRVDAPKTLAELCPVNAELLYNYLAYELHSKQFTHQSWYCNMWMIDYVNIHIFTWKIKLCRYLNINTNK